MQRQSYKGQIGQMNGHSVQERRCQAVSARQEQAYQTRSAMGRCRTEQGLRASGGWCRYLTVAGWWLTIDGFRFSVGGWKRRLAVGV